jgi:hypothetical protein
MRHQARQIDRPVLGEGRGEGDGKTEAIRAERQVRSPSSSMFLPQTLAKESEAPKRPALSRDSNST